MDARYPGFDATKRQAAAALRWAERVRDAAPALLGLPGKRTQRLDEMQAGFHPNKSTSGVPVVSGCDTPSLPSRGSSGTPSA